MTKTVIYKNRIRGKVDKINDLLLAVMTDLNDSETDKMQALRKCAHLLNDIVINLRKIPDEALGLNVGDKVRHIDGETGTISSLYVATDSTLQVCIELDEGGLRADDFKNFKLIGGEDGNFMQ